MESLLIFKTMYLLYLNAHKTTSICINKLCALSCPSCRSKPQNPALLQSSAVQLGQTVGWTRHPMTQELPWLKSCRKQSKEKMRVIWVLTSNQLQQQVRHSVITPKQMRQIKWWSLDCQWQPSLFLDAFESAWVRPAGSTSRHDDKIKSPYYKVHSAKSNTYVNYCTFFHPAEWPNVWATKRVIEQRFMSVQVFRCWMTKSTLFTQKLDHMDLLFLLAICTDSSSVYQAIE